MIQGQISIDTLLTEGHDGDFQSSITIALMNTDATVFQPTYEEAMKMIDASDGLSDEIIIMLYTMLPEAFENNRRTIPLREIAAMLELKCRALGAGKSILSSSGAEMDALLTRFGGSPRK